MVKTNWLFQPQLIHYFIALFLMLESNLAYLRHRQIIFVSHFTLVLIFYCSLKILNCFVIDLFNLIDFLKFFGWFLGWDFTLLQFLVQLLDSGRWSADARVRIYLIIAVLVLLQIWNRLFLLREWFLLHYGWFGCLQMIFLVR